MAVGLLASSQSVEALSLLRYEDLGAADDALGLREQDVLFHDRATGMEAWGMRRKISSSPTVKNRTFCRQPDRRVALLLQTSEYSKSLLRGIVRYNRDHDNCCTYLVPRLSATNWLDGSQCDGVVAHASTRETTDALLELGVPVVGVGYASQKQHWPFPLVCPDEEQISQLAAAHLLERGLSHFAFYGGSATSDDRPEPRAETFAAAVRNIGGTYHVFKSHPPSGQESWRRHQQRLANWISALPKPVGIMTCNDEMGLEILDICRRHRLDVPAEVAVIGAGNDEDLCNLGVPALSSIDINAEEMGYTAAVLLGRAMAYGESTSQGRVMTPRGAVTRRSSDVLSTADPDVSRAIRFINDRSASRLRVEDITRHTGLSRVALQQRMKKAIGRTIHEELERVRLARVKELLITDDMPIKQIARATGFCNVQYMTRVFNAAMGETPARYRAARQRAV